MAIGKKCRNPECRRRGEVIPFGDFFARSGVIPDPETGVGYLSECKECMAERSSRQKRLSVLEPSVYSEKLAARYLLDNGIPVLPGKAIGFAHVDLVVWGCVRIEVKYSTQNAAGDFRFSMSASQKKYGVRGELILLICDRGEDDQSYHLFDVKEPVFYMPDGRRKTMVTYNAESEGRDHRMMKDRVIMTEGMMLEAEDRLELIEAARLGFMDHWGDFIGGSKKQTHRGADDASA